MSEDPRIVNHGNSPRVQNKIDGELQADALVQVGSVYGDISLSSSSTTKVDVLRPRQLPAPPRNFVGRIHEISTLNRILQESISNGSSTVTVIDGSAGVGKTATAAHWAHSVSHKFPHGQLYVDLLGYSPAGIPMTPSDVLHGFLQALNVPPQRIPEHEHLKSALFRSAIAETKMLIILDNAINANQVRSLLPGTSSCFTVVTSRRKIDGLIAEDDAVPISLKVLTHADSTMMFTRRVGQVRTHSEPDSAKSLIELCAGLPLALGMISARLSLNPTLMLTTLLDDIRNARNQLDGFNSRDNRDVRTVSSWSYNALSDESAEMFRLLSLPPASEISLHGAASLAGISLIETKVALAELIESNLLEEPSPQRYKFHTLLLEYAKERASDEVSEEARWDALTRFFDFLLHSAANADTRLHPHRQALSFDPPLPGVTWPRIETYEDAMRWFNEERSTLLSSIHTAERQTRWIYAWKIPWACSTYFDRSGRWQDWISTQEVALTAARMLSDKAAEARTRRILANTYSRTNQFLKAKAHGEAAMSIFRDLGDLVGQARILRTMSAIYRGLENNDTSLEYSTKALQLYRELGDEYGQANTLCSISAVEHSVGQNRNAATHAEEASTLYHSSGDRYGQAQSLRCLADAYSGLQNFEGEVSLRINALEIYRELGNSILEIQVLHELSGSYRSIGDLDQARQMLHSMLAINSEVGMIDKEAIERELRSIN